MIELLQDIDHKIFLFIHADIKNQVFDFLCPIWRDKKTWIPLYVGLFILLFKNNSTKKILQYLLAVVILVAVSDLLCAKVLKEIFQRTRPCHLDILSGIVQPLIHCSDTYSLPSCHAMNHFAMASFFVWTKFKSLQWILWIWAGLVGFSQIYVGVHFPMDVLMGACIGVLLGKIFQVVYQKTTT